MKDCSEIKRVVIKVGTSTLAYSTGLLNLRRIHQLVEVISDLKNTGLEIVLVSSGAIGVGAGELGFSGVIVTDDLAMDAVRDFTDDSQAAVLAVQAGNDLLCCTDFEVQIPAVTAAVENGEISEERLNESVLRILELKLSLGLLKEGTSMQAAE